MKLVQDVLKNQYDTLWNTYMDSHRAYSNANMALSRFKHEVSRLVKWSRSGSTILLSYGQEIYEVTQNKKKKANGEPTYRVMKAKRVICSEYWRDMDNLRVDIVFDKLGEYK
jgi:hypothetical protein